LKVCELLTLTDLNYLHLFRDITNKTFIVSLDQLKNNAPQLWNIAREKSAQLRGIIFQCCPQHKSIFAYCFR